jgi:hypothetical protein
MPYDPHLPGSWGRSHSLGRSYAPKGVINKARNDDVALSAFVRDQWGSGSFGNASENPNPPAVIEEHGHRSKPVAYPRAPTPRHKSHEPHKPHRAALSSSLPHLGQVRNTLPLQGIQTDPQVFESYRPKHHHWYHPAGRKNQDMLMFNQGPRSFAADIRQSHNHIGFGDGIIGYGDIQHTSVSHDMPEWASGPRTVPGPYGTQGLKGDRVGRYMKPVISEGQMRTLVPSFKRGPNLSIVENWFDPWDMEKTPRSPAGSSTRSQHNWKKNNYGLSGASNQFGQPQFRAGITQKSSMHGGSCNPKRGYYPNADFVINDPVIHMHA